jgi:hypothetical protein
MQEGSLAIRTGNGPNHSALEPSGGELRRVCIGCTDLFATVVTSGSSHRIMLSSQKFVA